MCCKCGEQLTAAWLQPCGDQMLICQGCTATEENIVESGSAGGLDEEDDTSSNRPEAGDGDKQALLNQLETRLHYMVDFVEAVDGKKLRASRSDRDVAMTALKQTMAWRQRECSLSDLQERIEHLDRL